MCGRWGRRRRRRRPARGVTPAGFAAHPRLIASRLLGESTPLHCVSYRSSCAPTRCRRVCVPLSIFIGPLASPQPFRTGPVGCLCPLIPTFAYSGDDARLPTPFSILQPPSRFVCDGPVHHAVRQGVAAESSPPSAPRDGPPRRDLPTADSPSSPPWSSLPPPPPREQGQYMWTAL